jgi:hypothetical protein
MIKQEEMMKNRRLFLACMAGLFGASLLMTGVTASAEEFSDAPVEVTEEVTEEVSSEEVFDEGEEDMFGASADVAVNATNFPDAKFREYILANADTDANGSLSATEISAFKKIEVTELGISSLKGIENFTSLTSLFAARNSLTSVDLTKNTKLAYINLTDNKLTGTLNLSKCTAMITIYCANNSLTKVTMPAAKYLKKLDYYNLSNNKITSQANAGLSNISSETLTSLTEINLSNNQLASFDCSGFEGILDLSNNKITTLTGGAEGYQARAIYLEGSGNTLSKTASVDFATMGNRIPQRFSCENSVKSKIIMVSPKLSAKVNTSLNQITVTIGSTADNVSYVLYRKEGSGSYKKVYSWTADDLDDPELGDNTYTDKSVTAGKTYTYRLTATTEVQDRNKQPVSWAQSTNVTVKALPGTPAITVKSSKTKTATISWKAISGASGYEVYYGTSQSKVTSKVSTTTKVSVTKTGLTKGKTYYFKVRAYRTVSGKKVYSAYSSVKSVKVK